MEEKEQTQLPDEITIWPIAFHWFANGWTLPEFIENILGKASPYIPGSHGRIVIATDARLIRASDGRCQLKVPKLAVPFDLKVDNPKIGTGTYNFVVAIRTEDCIETWLLESNSSIEETISAALSVIVGEFLREMGTPEATLEFARFAAEHYPVLLNQDAVLQAFLMATATE
jgi:hypothetical protein